MTRNKERVLVAEADNILGFIRKSTARDTSSDGPVLGSSPHWGKPSEGPQDTFKGLKSNSPMR